MKPYILTTLLSVLLMQGCVSSSFPEDSRDFAYTKQLKSFEGVFQNRLDTNGYGTLSQDLFKSEKLSYDQHRSITQISVNIDGNKYVKLEALKGECILFSKTVENGVEFEFTGGQITLYSDTSKSAPASIGVNYNSITLGLDDNNDIKFRTYRASGGLALGIIPMFGSDTSDVRFRRVSLKPVLYNACGQGDKVIFKGIDSTSRGQTVSHSEGLHHTVSSIGQCNTGLNRGSAFADIQPLGKKKRMAAYNLLDVTECLILKTDNLKLH